MHIGIDIRSLMSPVRTGVHEYTFELLQALFTIDTQNHYYLFYNSHEVVRVPEWKQENVHYVHMRVPNKLFNFFQFVFHYPKLDTLIAKKGGIQKLDYFFSPNLNFTSLASAKHVLTVHDLSYKIFPDCYSKKQRWWHKAVNPKKQIAKADIIVCPSNNTKQDIVKHYKVDHDKIHVVYPGLSTAFSGELATRKKVQEKYNLPRRFVLFLGTLEPRKNIVGLIDAFELRHRVIEAGYECIIAGPKGWHYEDILKRIDKAEHTRYIGYVDREEKRALYELADLFVFPSLYEGFGFPVVEALAAGTPVVTSNRSSLVEVADNAAYLVNPIDTNDIGLGIERMLDSEALRKRMIQKGIEQSWKFNWHKSAKAFLSLLV